MLDQLRLLQSEVYAGLVCPLGMLGFIVLCQVSYCKNPMTVLKKDGGDCVGQPDKFWLCIFE